MQDGSGVVDRREPSRAQFVHGQRAPFEEVVGYSTAVEQEPEGIPRPDVVDTEEAADRQVEPELLANLARARSTR